MKKTQALETELSRLKDEKAAFQVLSRLLAKFVTWLAPEKGVHNLVAAYKRLRTDDPLVIIGDDTAGGEYRDSLFALQSEKHQRYYSSFLSDLSSCLIHPTFL